MIYRTLLLASAMLATSANAAITVDGGYDADYGTKTATVTYNAAAPNSNFGSPTSESDAIGYDIFLKAQDGQVFGFLQAGGPGARVDTFANVYFDIDPANANGSDLGFELNATSQRAFVPGLSGPAAVAGITTAASADGLGFEFAIPDALFQSAIAGLSYYPNRPFAGADGQVVLRLSQSFGYSVAGGSSFGPSRLGSVTLSGAVPEPATWAMMIGGFGAVGTALRRRRTTTARTVVA